MESMNHANILQKYFNSLTLNDLNTILALNAKTIEMQLNGSTKQQLAAYNAFNKELTKIFDRMPEYEKDSLHRLIKDNF